MNKFDFTFVIIMFFLAIAACVVGICAINTFENERIEYIEDNCNSLEKCEVLICIANGLAKIDSEWTGNEQELAEEYRQRYMICRLAKEAGI